MISMRKMILQCGAGPRSAGRQRDGGGNAGRGQQTGYQPDAVGRGEGRQCRRLDSGGTGGIPKNAGAVDSKGFLADPFANEKPLFVITAATVDKYKDKLSDGQMAMFKRYPETYRIPVYPTHRTAALPPEIYESAKRSALNVTPINDGNGLANFTGNRYYAFPIPKNGVEVIWNPHHPLSRR
jgi:hypothetical protein